MEGERQGRLAAPVRCGEKALAASAPKIFRSDRVNRLFVGTVVSFAFGRLPEFEKVFPALSGAGRQMQQDQTITEFACRGER